MSRAAVPITSINEDDHRPARTNERFWREKIAANQARDRQVDARLIADDWEVVRVWEHDDPADVVAQIVRTVQDRYSTLRDRSHSRET